MKRKQTEKSMLAQKWAQKWLPFRINEFFCTPTRPSFVNSKLITSFFLFFFLGKTYKQLATHDENHNQPFIYVVISVIQFNIGKVSQILKTATIKFQLLTLSSWNINQKLFITHNNSSRLNNIRNYATNEQKRTITCGCVCMCRHLLINLNKTRIVA